MFILDQSGDSRWSASWEAWLTPLHVEDSTEKVPFHPVPTFGYISPLACPSLSPPLVSYYKCTPAARACLRRHATWQGFSTAKCGGQGWGGGSSQAQTGLLRHSTICIIVCIGWGVSAECQLGRSVLISGLHRIDKRNTWRYKVILLPAARVKLFRRTRQAGKFCGCMNELIIVSWFPGPRSNSNWSGEFIIGCKSLHMHWATVWFFSLIY